MCTGDMVKAIVWQQLSSQRGSLNNSPPSCAAGVGAGVDPGAADNDDDLEDCEATAIRRRIEEAMRTVEALPLDILRLAQGPDQKNTTHQMHQL